MKEDKVHITTLIVCLFFVLELDFEDLDGINMIKVICLNDDEAWMKKLVAIAIIFGGGWI